MIEITLSPTSQTSFSNCFQTKFKWDMKSITDEYTHWKYLSFHAPFFQSAKFVKSLELVSTFNNNLQLWSIRLTWKHSVPLDLLFRLGEDMRETCFLDQIYPAFVSIFEKIEKEKPWEKPWKLTPLNSKLQ